MSNSSKCRSRSSSRNQRRGAGTPTFLKRAHVLQGELQKKTYPNAFTLAALCGCSRSTAMRTIDRLRYEFGAPIEYDESHRGYYLSSSNFSFAYLPPGRDELVALMFLSELASMIDDESLQEAISSLWARITNGRADMEHDLERIRNRFSSEVTSVARLNDVDLVRILTLCHRGQLVVIKYRSPWCHDEEKEYGGMFDRVHFSDGMLYALFKDHHSHQIVLNLSFISEIREVTELSPPAQEKEAEAPAKPFCLEGCGIWSGRKPETIEITIAPLASRYYSAQKWHVDQEDSWDGDKLIRRFPGTASPELTRKVLSLGRFVIAVKPDHILKLLREDVHHLGTLCAE